MHVGENSEELRSKWVMHEGKKPLVVNCNDFVLGEPTNDWASCVDGRPDCFSNQISKTIVEGLEAELLPNFTKITPAENIALKVTVMEACKNFYAYINCTCCGFPSIDLEGSDADWLMLAENAKSLLENRCTKDFSDWWLESLIPLLKKIVLERKNIKSGLACDSIFWNSMVKEGGEYGSGGYTWYNGWYNILMPLYGTKNRNKFCKPYSAEQDYATENPNKGGQAVGPDVNLLHKGLAIADVLWDYNGIEINLEYKAGFVGAT